MGCYFKCINKGKEIGAEEFTEIILSRLESYSWENSGG